MQRFYLQFYIFFQCKYIHIVGFVESLQHFSQLFGLRRLLVGVLLQSRIGLSTNLGRIILQGGQGLIQKLICRPFVHFHPLHQQSGQAQITA